MAIKGSKHSIVSSTPQGLNVQRFAESRSSELESLHSIVSERLNNNFRSRRNKRRRTSSYNNVAANNRCRKRRKLCKVDKQYALDLEKDQKKVPRHIRRRAKLRENPLTGFVTSGCGTKRLRTHVWHAKRFAMTKLWDFHLPLGLQGRGKGSRALLKWFKQDVLLHDASYYVAIQLEGPEDSLASLLGRVLVPSPVYSKSTSPSVLSGDVYGSAMLHQEGGPVSQPIAPVTYMWRPLDQQKKGSNAKESNVDGNIESIESCSPIRQLWVWLHASAFSEGYDALKFSCQNEMNDKGLLINCSSLKGGLGKLEVMGSKSFQLIQKLLHPLSGMVCSLPSDKCSDEEPNSSGSRLRTSLILENEEHFPSNAIVSLTVKDPRTLPERGSASLPGLASTSIPIDAEENEANEQDGLTGFPEKNRNSDIWDVITGASPPVHEQDLGIRKNRQHMDYFCLDHPNLEGLDTSYEDQCSNSCPIMLLKNTDKNGVIIGWSIILPLNWVRAFWVPFVSNGARAIGLREKHWISCEVGLPYFPSDFPDCNAYSCFMATEVAADNEKTKLRPHAVRPFKVPILPPWDSVQFALRKGHTMELDTRINESICIEDTANDNSSWKPDCASVDVKSTGRIVLRTGSMLTYFLKEIQGDHLLLFPHVPDSKTSLLKLMKGEHKFANGQDEIIQKHHPKLFFLRVHLYPYKEGVFEEGAVVCAPYLSDISCWTSRSADSEGGLQMHASSVRSYFKEQGSEWVVQVPEDPVAKESHRWPIGFVTTGFVRGSKRPVAEAFCEATLLARLREEQWSKMDVKQRKEMIYVLVRNLRSSAYRLAVASIILEQQEEDVKFM